MVNSSITPVALGLSVGVALIALFIVFMPSGPASDKLQMNKASGNVFGIDARVAYADASSTVLCPVSPCDTSGFVLKLVGSNKQDILVLGYDICNQSNNGVPLSCVHFEESNRFSSPIHLLKTQNNKIDDTKHNLPELEGVAVMLDRKMTVGLWEIGDNVHIRIKATPAIITDENGPIIFLPGENGITWSDLGISKIERYPIL